MIALWLALPLLWLDTSGDSSVSGWITAGATAGLLGPVLYWLCYVYLPAKDRQLKEMVEAKDRQTKEFHDAKDAQFKAILDAQAAEREKERTARSNLADTFQKAIADTHAAAAESAGQEREECQQRHKELFDQMLKTHETVREVRHEVANMAQERANARALEKVQQQHKQPKGGSPT